MHWMVCGLFLILSTIIVTSDNLLDLNILKGRVKKIFYYAYNMYMENAYPFDELQPLTCSGQDTWGSFSLTLVDSLDTLVVLGNHSEFRHAVNLILKQLDPTKNVNVSVFETNIRVIGGLLAAHLLSRRAGLPSEPGWPCHGKLLDLAERFASKILPAFNTTSGMPYGTINLALGDVPPNETPVTCVATIGTCILEFGTLSRLTGDTRYEQAAIKALRALWTHRSEIGLVGNHINVLTGQWVGKEATIGAGVDSYFEYLLKGSILFRLPELDAMFRGIEYRASIKRHLRFGSWHFMASMDQGSVSSSVFQSLEAFWPGVLALAGDISEAKEHIVEYHKIWKKYGFLPEMFDVTSGRPVSGRAAYPLRPEFIESVLHVYRATRDPYLIQIGVDILTSIESQAKAKCGYATIHDVREHELENRMESFFLSETIKYLYLLFDTDNFLNQVPSETGAFKAKTVGIESCDYAGGGFVFNSEAHPLDGGLIHCCSIQRIHELEATALLMSQSPGQSDLSDLTSFLNDFDTDSGQRKRQFSGVSFETCLLEEVDFAFYSILEPGRFVPNNSQLSRTKHYLQNQQAPEIGSDEWLTGFWDGSTETLLVPVEGILEEELYPPGYTPPPLRQSPPLLTCPPIPFKAHLQSLQDMDSEDLK